MAFRKLLVAAAVIAIGASGANVHPALPEVKRVYLLPMTSGLDQYLANRLTAKGRFEVVTDPANADAVFTDRLGPAFEDKWNEMYPPPPKPKPTAPDNSATKPDAKTAPPINTIIEDMSGPAVSRISSFSRGRGNVFLVSRKTGAVLWSHYKLPKNARSKVLDDTADDIVDRLQGDLKLRK